MDIKSEFASTHPTPTQCYNSALVLVCYHDQNTGIKEFLVDSKHECLSVCGLTKATVDLQIKQYQESIRYRCYQFSLLRDSIIDFRFSFMSAHSYTTLRSPSFILKICFEILQMTRIWMKLDSEGYTKCIERPRNRYSKLYLPHLPSS